MLTTSPASGSARLDKAVGQSSTRRLRQKGVSEGEAERAIAAIEKALADEGPLTRVGVRERLESAGLRTEGQALLHLLFLAAIRGVVVRGPMIGK